MPTVFFFITLWCAASAAPAYPETPRVRPPDVSWAYGKSEGVWYDIQRFLYETGKEVDVDREIAILRDAKGARALGFRLNKMGEGRKQKKMGWLTDKECLLAGACWLMDAQRDSTTRAVIEWKGCAQPREREEPPSTPYRERRCFLAGVYSDIYQIATPECESCGDSGYQGVKHELASRGRARLRGAKGVEIPGSYYEAMALLAEGTREDMDGGYALLSAISGMADARNFARREIEFHLAGVEFDKYLAELTEAFESAYSRLYRDCGALSELRVIEEACDRFLSFSPNPALGAIRAVCRACDIEFGGRAGGASEWKAILSDLAAYTHSTETLEFFKGLASYKLGQCPDVEEYFNLVTSDPGYRLAAAYCRSLCPLQETPDVKILEGLIAVRDSGDGQDRASCFARHFMAEIARSEQALAAASREDRERELDGAIARGASEAEAAALLFERYGILRAYEGREDGGTYLKAGRWAYGRQQYGLALRCYDRAREVPWGALSGPDEVRRVECRLRTKPSSAEEIAAVGALRDYSNSRDREEAKPAFDALMRYSNDLVAGKVSSANAATSPALARWAHEWGEYCLGGRLLERLDGLDPGLAGKNGIDHAECRLYCSAWTGRETDEIRKLMDWSHSGDKTTAERSSSVLQRYAADVISGKIRPRDPAVPSLLADWN